ncbi:MAG TPA: type VI secretion system baseplate subunit TssF, partial [Nannocystis sp.]
LQHFRGAARELGERHPGLAGQRGQPSDDPDLQRLIEAHAFLTAGVHARLDAAAPAFVEALGDLLLPHVLRGVPSATIVELTPNLASLRARQRIARHRPLLARTIDGTACRFRTCFDLDLLPLELTTARLDDRIATRPQIRLTLRTRDACRGIFGELDRLRLYVHHAAPAQAATLMQWFCRHCTGLALLDGEAEHARLPATAIDPIGLRGDPPIYPWPDTAPPAHRLLLERFTLPERAHFLDIVGLHAVAPQATELTLVFSFDRPPPLPAQLDPGTFRLHCTPAVNLFDTTAAAIHHTPLTREHLLRPDDLDPRHTEVHAVTRVLGHERARGTRRCYGPLHDLSPEPGAPRYALRRAAAVDGGVDTFLLPREAPGAAHFPDELLSVDLVCSNRDLPLQLGAGDLTGAPPGALFRSYRNLTPVTPPIRAPLGDDAQWHLLAHLGLAARGLHDPEALRVLLGLHNAPARLRTPLGRANARQIDAIRTIERSLATRVHRGAATRTIRTRVELDEAAFASPGHAFLFSALLDRLFAGAAPFLTASELHTVLQPSAAELSWPPHLPT